MTRGLPSSTPQAFLASTPFDWAVVALSAWLVGGIHLDAWAHHRIGATLETFFTPWHGVLYSGFLALASLLIARLVLGLRQGRNGRGGVSDGYGLSLLGIPVFLLGGLGDMAWHLLFGIEVNIEALLSPTHLLLALGGGLMITGPVRAAGRGATSVWPAVISLAFLLSLLLFFTAYANPLSEGSFAQGVRPSSTTVAFFHEALGIAGSLLYTAFSMGLVLYALSRWRLPFGALTTVFGLSTLLAASPHEQWNLLPMAVLSGLIADGLLRWLKASTRPKALRLFSFLVPVTFFALYFTTLAVAGGVWWGVPLWAGLPMMAGVLAWLFSYAFVPATESEAARDSIGPG